MLRCFSVSSGTKQVSVPFDKMSQAEHVQVEQPGAVAKPLLPRKGVCCFGTPACGSSCWSSRREQVYGILSGGGTRHPEGP